MDEIEEAERFSRELDLLLAGRVPAEALDRDLKFAGRLAASDFSADSALKRSLREDILEGASAPRREGLLPPLRLALGAAAAGVVLVPVAMHLHRFDAPGVPFDGRDPHATGPLFPGGEAPYDGSMGGIAPGGLIGGGDEPVITPLNARDPSALVMGPGVSHPPPAAVEAAESGFTPVAARPVSAFAIEGEAADYADVRRWLDEGLLPPAETVRVAELVNAVRYEYPEPRGTEAFAVALELAACPWEPKHKLVRIGLRGRGAPEHLKLSVAVEFNPAKAEAWRRIDDATAAAEYGVTVLYEIIPAEPAAAAQGGERLKYQNTGLSAAAARGELLTVTLRHRPPGAEKDLRVEHALADANRPWSKASPDLRFAAAAAGFGLLLRDSGSLGYDELLRWGREAAGPDPGGERARFLALVEKARALDARPR